MRASGTRPVSAGHRRASGHLAGGAGSDRKAVYRLGGVAALITVLVALLDIVVSFLAGERDVEPGSLTATDWFARFRESRFLTLRDLGLWNVVNDVLAVPVYLALYEAHRRENRGFAALAAILSFIGAAAYAANNKALPMLDLSDRYAAASTDVERTRLAAAGQAMLAQGEDFTPGSFVGLFPTEVAGIVMGVTMIRSRIFGRPAAWAGIAGSSLLLAFTVCVTFVPALFRRVMVLAVGGGILSIVWRILTARALFQLGKDDRRAKR